MTPIFTGDEIEMIPDFRIEHVSKEWKQAQEEYIKYHEFYKSAGTTNHFKHEIFSVKEIYQHEFHLKGKILDVGGAQGKLRHFLKGDELNNYVCLDPFPEALEGLGNTPGLFSSYKNLNTPMQFVAAYAEHLPFKDNIFDTIHMRSVLDHFADAKAALLESYRVLKPTGYVLIGLNIKHGVWLQNKPKLSLFARLRRKIYNILFDQGKPPAIRYLTQAEDHVKDWSREELITLVQSCGFKVIKEHRQKPPFGHCLYLLIQK